MQVGANAGEGAGSRTASDMTAVDFGGHFGRLELDGSFAVIHDEPYFTIVWDSGEFRGTIVDATLERLEKARQVAAKYHLAIEHVRMDYHGSFDIRLREVHDYN